MFTRTTGRRYVLPSSASIRRQRLGESARRFAGCVCIAALFISPAFLDALLRP